MKILQNGTYNLENLCQLHMLTYIYMYNNIQRIYEENFVLLAFNINIIVRTCKQTK